MHYELAWLTSGPGFVIRVAMTLSPTQGADLLEALDKLEAQREYSRGELMDRRCRHLVTAPAGFFRSAPALFYSLVSKLGGVRPLLGRETRWIVGDVHLENVGCVNKLGRKCYRCVAAHTWSRPPRLAS